LGVDSIVICVATRKRFRCCAEFRLSKFFLFSGEAKIGQFRLVRPLQVVCDPPVSEWRWGEIV
jgi:hypothetical protein